MYIGNAVGVWRTRGFTLMELVVVLALLGLLAAAGTNMVGDTMTTAYYVTHNHSSGSKARYAVERMTREIREVAYGPLGYSMTMGANTLSFTKEDGTAVTIASSGGNLQLTYSGTTAVLTDQVSAFAFAYFDLDNVATSDPEQVRFVQVTIELTNAKTLQKDSIRTRIFLRNAQASPT
jgi:prepilin-type N-terminal cleavage/methylation domain-containing protein